MTQDHSWAASAGEYEKVYERGMQGGFAGPPGL